MVGHMKAYGANDSYQQAADVDRSDPRHCEGVGKPASDNCTDDAKTDVVSDFARLVEELARQKPERKPRMIQATSDMMTSLIEGLHSDVPTTPSTSMRCRT